jgi:hypothetical protein
MMGTLPVSVSVSVSEKEREKRKSQPAEVVNNGRLETSLFEPCALDSRNRTHESGTCASGFHTRVLLGTSLIGIGSPPGAEADSGLASRSPPDPASRATRRARLAVLVSSLTTTRQ